MGVCSLIYYVTTHLMLTAGHLGVLHCDMGVVRAMSYFFLECAIVYPYNSTGWRGLVGFPKSQIIFHKRATKYRSLLRKLPMKIRDLMSLRHPVTCTHIYLTYAGEDL